MKYRISIFTMVIGFLALIGAAAPGGVAMFCYIIASVIVEPPEKQPPKSLN